MLSFEYLLTARICRREGVKRSTPAKISEINRANNDRFRENKLEQIIARDSPARSCGHTHGRSIDCTPDPLPLIGCLNSVSTSLSR